uniref:Uncharacterized protein n=1 Tax=Helicotheca tamesis TaxID=374047 RepID=A0A7S2I498_9STRA
METMRKANLEIEFGGSVDFACCTQCLHTDLEQRKKEASDPSHRRRRSRKRRNNKKTKPCLVCGSPVCPRHCDQTFRKQNKIRICNECSPLFSHDFIVNCLDITIPDEERRRNIDRMMDTYDRTRLLLKYSSQYIDEIANALQCNTKRNNGVTLGTCATSVASSVAGAVGIATIFTPLGPHLLIASLFFSGSATVVQSGSEAVNYFAEPNKLANKIIAMHAMMKSILSVTDVLRSALSSEQVRVDPYLDGGAVKDGALENEDEDAKKPSDDKSKTAGIVVGRNTRLVTRASATVMRSARVALAAGGALTAASILLETNEMIRVTGRMRKGNPNKKADLIREIKKEVEDLPDTHVVAEECEKFFELMVAKPISAAALLEKGEGNMWVGENNLEGVKEDQVLDAISCLEMQAAIASMEQPQGVVESPMT